MITLEEIDKRIPILLKRAEIFSREEEIRDRYPKANPYKKMIREYERAKEFIELGQKVCEHSQGLIVNDKYIIARKKMKWRVQGKSTWYYYKDVPTFVKKYILEEDTTVKANS